LLLLTGRPSEAETQVRVVGRPGRSRRSRIIRTVTGRFSRLRIRLAGVAAIEVRYIDPYDIQRTSRWLTLPARAIGRRR
jgi:hypothetical protein